jgi:hypothetical protein
VLSYCWKLITKFGSVSDPKPGGQKRPTKKVGFRIWIRIYLSCWIRIRIQISDPDLGGQKLSTKIEKIKEISNVPDP